MKLIALAILAICISGALAGVTYTNSQAVSKLSAAGISVRSSGGCSDRSNSRCTSLDGIHSEAIDGPASIIVLKRATNCPITITGGTEVGHASGTYSHGNGWKLDISMNSCLTSYITRTFQSIGGGKWKAGSGNVYYDEGNHWDITFAPKN